MIDNGKSNISLPHDEATSVQFLGKLKDYCDDHKHDFDVSTLSEIAVGDLTGELLDIPRQMKIARLADLVILEQKIKAKTALGLIEARLSIKYKEEILKTGVKHTIKDIDNLVHIDDDYQLALEKYNILSAAREGTMHIVEVLKVKHFSLMRLVRGSSPEQISPQAEEGIP